MSYANLPLGCLPKDPNAKHLMLAKYLVAANLPVAPDSWDGYLGGKAAPKMYMNDTYGDCTIAGLANQLRIQAAVDGLELPEFTDKEIVDFYFGMTGGADSGLVETDVLDRVVRLGFPGDGRCKFKARATIDHTSWEDIKLASYLFGGLYLGVALPISTQALGDHWSVQGDGKTGNDAPGSWGGHCIVLSGHDMTPSPFDKPGNEIGNVSVATWGNVIYATKHWITNYCEEAHVFLTEKHLELPWIDKITLLADLGALDQG